LNAAKKKNLSMVHALVAWLLLIALPASSLASYNLHASGAAPTHEKTRVWIFQLRSKLASEIISRQR